MSTHATSFVLDHSEAKGLERLVLWSHADNARGHEPPWLSWTSTETVTHQTRGTRRGVQLATNRLVAKKRLLPTGEFRGGAPVYSIATDAEADRVDRVARLAREEKERERNRGRRANAVRRGETTDPTAPTGESDTPLAGERNSPDRGDVGSPDGANPVRQAGANSATPGGELSNAKPERSSPKPSVLNPAASKDAAAAGTPASSSSSSEQPDPGVEYFSRATDLLMLRGRPGGFGAEAIAADRAKIRTELRKHAAKLSTLDWDALVDQLEAGRADGTIVSPTPIGALAFLLRQTIPAGRPPAPPGRPASAGVPGRVADRLTMPAPTDDAAAAWRELRSGLEGHPDWPKVRSDVEQWLTYVHPLTLNGNELRITTAIPNCHGYVETQALPVLNDYARGYLNGRVVLVPRAEAAA